MTETCGVDNVFPPDDLWIGLDTYTNCVLRHLYLFVLRCLTNVEWDGI